MTPNKRYSITASAGGPPKKPYAVWDRHERKAVAHYRTISAARADARARNRAD